MTFAAQETALTTGQPFHLYRFVFGSGVADVLMYTNIAETVTRTIDPEADDYVFQPLAITHGDVVASGSLDKATVPITVPDEGDLADLYSGEAPQGGVHVTVWQGHVGEDEVKVAFSGRVVSARFGDAELVIDVEPIGTVMERPGLSRHWQYTCPLVLYGADCRANRAAATRSTTVSSVTGPLVTLPTNWAPTDLKPKHQGGVFIWVDGAGRTVRRAIEEVDGNQLRLSSTIIGMAGGASISLVLGCNHLMDDCETVHNNIQNFGGQPQIPLKNPIGFTNSYY